MPIYENQKELKFRMKKAGLNVRDLANQIKIPPGTISGWLGGWAPLTSEYRVKILQVIKAAESNLVIHVD